MERAETAEYGDTWKRAETEKCLRSPPGGRACAAGGGRAMKRWLRGWLTADWFSRKFTLYVRLQAAVGETWSRSTDHVRRCDPNIKYSPGVNQYTHEPRTSALHRRCSFIAPRRSPRSTTLGTLGNQRAASRRGQGSPSSRGGSTVRRAASSSLWGCTSDARPSDTDCSTSQSCPHRRLWCCRTRRMHRRCHRKCSQGQAAACSASRMCSSPPWQEASQTRRGRQSHGRCAHRPAPWWVGPAMKAEQATKVVRSGLLGNRATDGCSKCLSQATLTSVWLLNDMHGVLQSHTILGSSSRVRNSSCVIGSSVHRCVAFCILPPVSRQ